MAKKEDAIAPVESATIATNERPSWIPEGDTTGTEMDAADLRLPRLSIAQGLSPELTPGDPRLIFDLKMFQLFNNLTQEIYGMGPLIFIPVRKDIRRIEFKPRKEGGGVIDMNVPVHDPRNEWTNDPTDATGKKRVPPIATKFTEYVVLLLQDGQEEMEPIVISIKDTNKENRRATTNLNGYIGLPTKIGNKKYKLPIYGKMYSIESGTGKNDKGTYGVPIIKQVGVVHDATIGNKAMAFAKMLEGKTIDVERDAPSDEEIDTGVDAPAPEM